MLLISQGKDIRVIFWHVCVQYQGCFLEHVCVIICMHIQANILHYNIIYHSVILHTLYICTVIAGAWPLWRRERPPSLHVGPANAQQADSRGLCQQGWLVGSTSKYFMNLSLIMTWETECIWRKCSFSSQCQVNWHFLLVQQECKISRSRNVLCVLVLFISCFYRSWYNGAINLVQSNCTFTISIVTHHVCIAQR